MIHHYFFMVIEMKIDDSKTDYDVLTEKLAADVIGLLNDFIKYLEYVFPDVKEQLRRKKK